VNYSIHKIIKAFTLIELILVIAILGILSVSVTVLVFNYSTANLEVVSKKIASDIKYAQDLAMTNQGTIYGAYFDSANNQYTAYKTNINTPVADPMTRENLIENFANFSGITIIGGDYTVEFNEKGAPITGGGGSVSITDGTNTKTISVIANTGKVKIQ
jgi:prepilin-type N-terminal cleavage/methylation domain-containing protein